MSNNSQSPSYVVSEYKDTWLVAGSCFNRGVTFPSYKPNTPPVCIRTTCWYNYTLQTYFHIIVELLSFIYTDSKRKRLLKGNVAECYEEAIGPSSEKLSLPRLVTT